MSNSTGCIAIVSICLRFGGSSSKTETSKSPYIESIKVLGIGVAVIAKTCGASDFEIKALRCKTPNLCCSSITNKAGLSNFTSSEKTA